MLRRLFGKKQMSDAEIRSVYQRHLLENKATGEDLWAMGENDTFKKARAWEKFNAAIYATRKEIVEWFIKAHSIDDETSQKLRAIRDAHFHNLGIRDGLTMNIPLRGRDVVQAWNNSAEIIKEFVPDSKVGHLDIRGDSVRELLGKGLRDEIIDFLGGTRQCYVTKTENLVGKKGALTIAEHIDRAKRIANEVTKEMARKINEEKGTTPVRGA